MCFMQLIQLFAKVETKHMDVYVVVHLYKCVTIIHVNRNVMRRQERIWSTKMLLLTQILKQIVVFTYLV